MAAAAVSLWPAMWGEDWADARDDAVHQAHRPIRLAALARRLPALSPAWANVAVGRLLRGEPPRLRGVAPEIEWEQLTLAIAPGGLTLVVPLDDGPMAAEWIRASEWLARHGGVSVVVLTRDWPRDAAFERILHGARSFAPASGAEREPSGDTVVSDDETLVLALPPAPEGQPHPMSRIEQLLYRLIQADEELRPLFAFNRTVPNLALLTAKPDLLWLDGRVAIEIDGIEHRGAAKFRADRNRDYELMCAGYRVLRMTNEDVATDAAVAVEKIRRVARLAKGEAR